MGKLSSLVFSMLKVGVIGFGGGNALIPVIEEEAVNNKKLVTKEEYNKDIIAATLTPGALPVELASGVGLQSCGLRGMILGGVAMALPGAIFTLLFLGVLENLSQEVTLQVQYASIGITAVIMCLLTQYIQKTMKEYKDSRWRPYLWIVMLGVFLVTGGKTLLQIAGYRDNALPRFSTVAVLLLTILVSIIFSFVRYSTQRKKRKKKKQSIQAATRPLVTRTLLWLVFFGLLSLPGFLISAHAMGWFDAKALFSSLMSFGGGDAYLTIADGLFVPDYVSANEFYNHLVLIVNVFPGSILCKTLTGIGYYFGKSLGGTAGALAFAAGGFACSVAASCGVFHVIYQLGDWLEDFNVFIVIKKVIRVVVSGLLLTVMASLIFSGMEMNANPKLPGFTVLIMIGVIYGINLLMHYRFQCKNKWLIIVSLVISMGVCNVLGV
ncbi:MAG: chromate transporter [Eubacterium sp.]|nr:chromate transporter [Eubacterium sp.]